MPVLAAFLTPWNATIFARHGRPDDPILRERIDYPRTFA
jgi:hypothetical protein